MSQVYDTSQQKFEALTSVEINIYLEEKATFYELRDLYDEDEQKFQCIIIALNETDMSFEQCDELYDEDEQKFQCITTALNKTYMTFDECDKLYDEDEQKFQLIVAVLNKTDMTFDQSNNLYCELSELYDTNKQKFQALTSEAALFLYDKGIKFTDISALNTSDQKYREIMNIADNALHRANADELIEQVNKILLEEKNKPKEKRKFTDDIEDRRQEALNKPKISNKRTYAESLQEQRQEEMVKRQNTKGV